MSLMRNLTTDGRRRSLATGLASLALLTLVLSGCNKGGRVSIDDLQAENAELRDRNQQIESALNDSESARAAIEAERDGLLKFSWEDPEIAHDEKRPPRKYYEVTNAGRDAVDESMRRFEALQQFEPAARRAQVKG